MANYQVTTAAGKVYDFATDLTAAEATRIVEGLPRTSFLDWVLSGDSEKQTLWTLKVAQDTLNAQTPEAVGPFLSLVAQINRMQEGAKRTVNLRFDGGITLKAVTKGFNTGCIYVYVTGSYVGKITKDGVFKASSLESSDSIVETLGKIAKNPEKASREYGRGSGICGCCGRELSDPVSIFGGIGPVCLERLSGSGARAELEADFREFQAESLLDAVLASV
jgi:hypothetical protein